MSLQSGDRIGAYEVIDALGAGGMGEVYRARDTTLGRDVAIKVLPESLATDAERLVRFDREARLLASISHPNIAHVYGVEPCGSSRAIVMELVPGPTLADQLQHGAMGAGEALTVARQIATALAAAHDQGIVHRDVKPSNVKASETGVVKVLDFGLAKALIDDPLTSAEASTVVSPAMTARGVILGTAAYMSPEQARGKPVDKRADVWAFGCVLYEMLTGARAFPGEDVQDTLVAVLSREPDWSRLPPIPGRIRTLLRRCLSKDRAKRLADMHDAVLEIDDQLRGDAVPAETPVHGHRWTRWIPWTLAASALIVAAGLAVDRWWVPAPAPAEWRLDVVTPRTAEPTMFALSPDGRRIVFVALSGLRSALWLRDLQSADGAAAPIGGTPGATLPFWSPDGKAIGFFADGRLKRVDLGSGTVRDLTAAPNARGGSWSAHQGGMIVFARGLSEGIWRIAGEGGSPSRVTTVQEGQIEQRHPSFLDDGRRFFFAAQAAGREHQSPGGLFIADLNGSAPIRLQDGVSRVTSLSADRILFVGGSSLLIQQFDGGAWQPSDEPVTAISNVQGGLLGDGAFSWRAGVLAYRRSVPYRTHVQWLSAAGSAMSELGTPGNWTPVEISPDDRRAVTVRDEEVFTIDFQTGRGTPQVKGSSPIWSFNGRAVFFATPAGIWSKVVDTDEGATQILRRAGAWPVDVSNDGRMLIFGSVSPQTSHDLWSVALSGGLERQITRSTAREFQGQLSPDNEWLAYTSNETGQPEIWVKRLSEGSAPRRVSTAGGVMPRWRHSGGELLYVSLDARMTAVPVTISSGTIQFGTPRELFLAPVVLPLFQGTGVRPFYDLSKDGRFLIAADRSEQEPITVVLNWQLAGKQ